MPVDPVQDALDALAAAYPASKLSAVRSDVGERVVLTLRGNFETFGPFPPASFDAGPVVWFVQQFWASRRRLFDPSPGGSAAHIPHFQLTGLSQNLAIVTGQQVAIVKGTMVPIKGAILTARIAARPTDPGNPVTWQLDGFDNSLVSVPSFGPTIIPVNFENTVKAASKAVFGRADVLASSAESQSRFFPHADGLQLCLMIAFPAQPRLVGKWKRGAIVYWSLDPDATKPLHVEPDGSYAQVLPDNTGPYHPLPTDLHVLPTAAVPGNATAPGPAYELVDDSYQSRQGPKICTGRFLAKTVPTKLPEFLPLVGTGWQDNRAVASRVNPGVATDAHAFAHDVVGTLLDMRDRNGITGAILPDSINVAIQVYPAAQPGEWRKSGAAVVIANADDSLPRSWMKRWAYCSDHTVVAHELGHAVVYASCGLDYCLESGALDEGLADLFAVLVTGSVEIFDGPWIRSDTIYFRAAKALRNATWSAALPKARLTPNDRVERGTYPNHYADFARLHASNDKATKLAKPRNDHGYIHWNCAIVTRALAMLAQAAHTPLRHPETQLTATAIGAPAVGDLALSALRLVLKDQLITNSDTGETPFAQMRAALLSIATSTQFDQNDDRRLYAAQIINACNAAGIGPILSVRGRPAGVPARYMPALPAAQPGWQIKLEQEGEVAKLWRPGDIAPFDLMRGKDVAVTAQVANLGVSSDRAIPSLSVLIEGARDSQNHPTMLKASDPVIDGRRLSAGEVITLSAKIKSDDLPAFADPSILVMATDSWNALRGSATARAAIKAGLRGRSFDLPLNAALIRLRLT